MRICRRCEQPFERAPRARTIYCPRCRPVVRNERSRGWSAANPEKRRAARNKWAAENADQMRACRRKWRDANMSKVREYRRHSKRKNALANRAYVAAGKARELGVPIVYFTIEALRARLAFFDDRCWMCGAEADTLDHVKPMSRGGAHMLANIRPACLSCNSRKNDAWPLPKAA